ncbi:putative IclR-family regulatory protein [Desulfoluna limicola]|uniref:IclR-family regulatory protein n=1 Tax=Desulfoluna limicola TaxID=2810562 RepID=A0ABM7PH54_9BACT|nr:helix-turn-helix domain-containing protein [Desulfoluna limicola]BCS96547.1 putative IclR-family regulatory protein [Desulfoluna limicola]
MIQGAQSVYRTLNILKMIIQRGENPTTLKEVSEAMEITTSTAHRLLSVLKESGFILFDPKAKTYTIGADSVIYSGLSMDRYVRTSYGALAGNVARLFGYTASLFVREGDECTCVGMYQGANPIQLAAVRPAEKALLGYGSATMGILAFLDDEEVTAILDRNLPRLQDVLLEGKDKVLEYIALSRSVGYGYAESLLIKGGAGISYPLKHRGKVVGALAVDAVIGKEWETKRPELVRYLKQHLE